MQCSQDVCGKSWWDGHGRKKAHVKAVLPRLHLWSQGSAGEKRQVAGLLPSKGIAWRFCRPGESTIPEAEEWTQRVKRVKSPCE